MTQDVTVLVGDCRKTLPRVPSGTVDCCVTSPPYFGLRDYDIEGQVGEEVTATEYIQSLVEAFQEVHRVLKPRGTCFVNIGDTYAGYKDGKFVPQSNAKGDARGLPTRFAPHRSRVHLQKDGYRHKELMGIPWRFAFAMRDAGWRLRQDIIWAKANYTPEAVRDRFIRSHEHLFMFVKQDNYHFDGDACRVPSTDGTDKLRPDVWTIPTSRYKGKHYATFPPALVEPCIAGGVPEGGLVLDPFAGVGTTAGVAVLQGKRALLCELNPSYVDRMKERVSTVAQGVPFTYAVKAQVRQRRVNKIETGFKFSVDNESVTE